MGIPYFTTLIKTYLFSNRDPFKSVNLTENVIIDGYSFLYFICYMIEREDENKLINQRITATKFAYDGLSEQFRSILKQFQDNCAKVSVVFDGIYESKKHRRPDPKRDSTVQFNKINSRVLRLLHDQLMSILHELNIEVSIAPGKADPMIVQMARECDAYIVARDSDYFLYETSKGYVPLDTLVFTTLLKLWLHTKTEHSNSLKMTLLALIISFLKHALLDTHGEMKERSPQSEVFPGKPYRQHSHRKLKSYISRQQCSDLRQNIKIYAKTDSLNDEIEKELEECQQLYKELLMINQFFGQPLYMPPPGACFSRLTYPLPIYLRQSNSFRKDIKMLCSGNEFLTEFIKELYDFFVASIPSSIK